MERGIGEGDVSFTVSHRSALFWLQDFVSSVSNEDQHTAVTGLGLSGHNSRGKGKAPQSDSESRGRLLSAWEGGELTGKQKPNIV